MTNMGLEDILQELSKYGRPGMNQYAVSASFDSKGNRHTAGGSWGCEVSVPSRWPEGKDVGGKDRGTPVTGWRMIGRGQTPTEAANNCLTKCMELAEGPLAPYAKFITTDMVLGK